MKITINMDDELLEDAMRIMGASTKTEAIHTALREVVRRARLIELLKEGSGKTPEELGEMFDPASDPMKLRMAEGVTPYHVVSDRSKK